MPVNQYPYADMLARVMYEIKDDPVLLALALKDPVLAKWWGMRKEKEEKRIAAELKKKQTLEEKARLKVIKDDLLKRLSDDEKKALGIKLPDTTATKKPKKKSSPKPSRSIMSGVYTILDDVNEVYERRIIYKTFDD